MLDNRNGEEPDEDSDTLRYCVLIGVGGTCICAWDVGQRTAKIVPSTFHGPIASGRTPVRTSSISERPGIRPYLNGHRMRLHVERRFGALLPGSSRTPRGANPVGNA
jgi:hypothetical protein